MRAQEVRSRAPETAQEAAALLQDCAADAVGVRIAGAGTKPWGSPGGECGVELRTAALDAIVEHNRGDFTAIVQPGVSLRELEERFADSGQMLALDPPFGEDDAATIGGAIATGDSGPL
ncbi:MAG TPA: FAD-binding protein, partial [Solirubrobacteraceae bacterium]|nr:FAD-binding protein [Solirubrobacteraceae bacterium]